jgi:hypothetical protein
MKRVAQGCLAAVLTLACAGAALGQESKSAPLAKQLTAALDAAKIDSAAAKDPANPDIYVAVLYIPGFQLLAISAKYSAPTLLDARLASKEYREVYIDLNSAGTPDSRLFIEDLGGDGLRARREDNQAFDSVENAGKRMMFDNEWRKQQLSEQDYLKAFAAADERYSQILALILGQLKKTS